jgi:hypothetical protein
MLRPACIFILIFLTGCRGCVNQLYGTNGHEYLDITFETPAITYPLTIYYFDSVLNRDVRFPDSIKSKFYISSIQTDLHEGNRLVHFTEGPEEWYLVELLGGQTVIDVIYNPDLNGDAIFDKKYLSEAQLARITNRMQTEVISPMKMYGETQRIPAINDRH